MNQPSVRSDRVDAPTQPARPRRGVDRDLPITMSDGTVLLADHYWPRDGSPAVPEVGAVVWIRTAYGRRGMRSFGKRFARLGAHVLVEGVRGSGDGSGGEFSGIRLPAGDGRDVAAWLRRQAWYPDRIVTWGLSYLGTASWALAETDIPDWRVAIVQDAQADARATMWPGGVFNGVLGGFLLAVDQVRRHPRASVSRVLVSSILGARKVERELGVAPLGRLDERVVGHEEPFFREWLDHADDEAYWDGLDLRRHATRMPDRVLLTTGWYDTGLASTLPDHAALVAAGKQAQLVVGNWYHGQSFRDKAFVSSVDEVVARAVRGEEPLAGSSGVRVYVGGAEEWRDLPTWPPPSRPARWYLQPDGGLGAEPAPDGPPDRFMYDPADPTPSVGGAQEAWTGNAGAKDNRKLEARTDVLTYTSEPLPRAMELIGPVSAEVWFRSSRKHTDVFVRLCDVDECGRSTNLCDGIRRLRPGMDDGGDDGIRRVGVDLVAIGHRFLPGHRLRVQVSSGAHPLRVRNLGTGEPLATGTAMAVADQEVFHGRTRCSHVTLPLTEH